MTLICSAYYFEKSLWSLLDHHGPFLHKIVTTRPRVPWINDEILIAKQHRRKAERRWRASRSGTDLLSFRSCRNRLTFHMKRHAVLITLTLLMKTVSTKGNTSLHVKSCLTYWSVLVVLYIPIPINWLTILASSSVKKLTPFGLRLLAKVALPTLANPSLHLMAHFFLNYVFSLKSKFMIYSNLLQRRLVLLTPFPWSFLLSALVYYLLAIFLLFLIWKRALVKPLLKKENLDPIFKTGLWVTSHMPQTLCRKPY